MTHTSTNAANPTDDRDEERTGLRMTQVDEEAAMHHRPVPLHAEHAVFAGAPSPLPDPPAPAEPTIERGRE